MTNIEAIKAIKDNYPPAHYSILRESLDMAIILLEKSEHDGANIQSLKEEDVMVKLNTIQKREKLNDVLIYDKRGNGGANHIYIIKAIDGSNDVHLPIHFQNGARKEEDSKHGVIDTDLLEIVRHRLLCFQSGTFASRENEEALRHIEEALMWMNRRVEDRIERNVLGTYNK